MRRSRNPIRTFPRVSTKTGSFGAKACGFGVKSNSAALFKMKLTPIVARSGAMRAEARNGLTAKRSTRKPRSPAAATAAGRDA